MSQTQPQQISVSDFDHALRPSGWLLAAETAVGGAIRDRAVARTAYDPTTLDLLLRLRLAPANQLRGIDLCRQLLLSKSHVSRMIDRAERDGLVRREADPHDRRAQQVTLTGAGEEAVETYAPYLLEVLNQTIYNTLTDEEVETFVDLLSRVAESARQLLDRPDPTHDPTL